MKNLIVAGAALLVLASHASATVTNIAPGSALAVVTQSSDYGGGTFPAKYALDRNYGNFTHTAGEPTDNWWRVDLGAVVPIDHVVLHNRGDGCCPTRLRDITISLFDFDGNQVDASGVLNPNNELGGPKVLAYAPPPRLFARYIQVTRKASNTGATDHEANALSLGEVEIFADNIALFQSAVQSSTLAGYPASNGNDGNPSSFSHTDAEATPNWWQVDLGASYEIDSVLMLNRDSCCGGRLRDITVDILNEALESVFTSPLLNPKNSLGAGEANYQVGPPMLGADLNQLYGGTVFGRFVRITRTPSGVGSHDGNVISLGDVQVYGKLPEGVAPTITGQPASQNILMGGGAVTFKVTALGTEPLSYFWYKNGSTVLPSQTSATLTLNTVSFADMGSYSAVVSNITGSVTSSPASLHFFYLNAALTGTATQSTTDNGGVPSRAIDGNTDGIWGDGSVTHTGNTPIDNEWWEVDLGAQATIDLVNVYFRTDCCPQRNESLRIVIYDDPSARNEVWTQEVGANPGASKGFTVPHKLGQVVRVEHIAGTDAQVLSLAEVQVGTTPGGGNLLWVGGNPDNTWDLGITANWDPGTMTPEVFQSIDSVTFDDSSVVTTVNLVGTLDPLYVNVNTDNGYAFEGTGQIDGYKLTKTGVGPLILANSAANSFLGEIAISDSTLVLNSGADTALNCAISGNGSVRKEGSYRTTLSSYSSYSGGTVVNGGTLQIQNNQALGDINSSITVNDGASLDLTSSELWNYVQPIFIGGAGQNGAGALTKSATGNQNGLAIRSLTLNADASIGGAPNARIDIGRGDWTYPPLPVAGVHLDGQGHSLSLVGNIYLGILAGGQNLSQVIVNSGTVLAPHNDNSLGEATVVLNGGTNSPWGGGHVFANRLILNSGYLDNQGFEQTYTGPVEINGPVQVNTISGGNITFNGNITGAGAVTKVGAYTVLLGGDNSGFAGSYDNEESNTFFASDTAGSARADWVLNNGHLASYSAGDHVIQLGSLSGSGGLVANNLASPNSGQVTFVIGGNDKDSAFAGQIVDTLYQAGTVAITKTGAGKLTLGGNNTYRGPTVVSDGILEVTTVNSLGGGARSVEIAGTGKLALSFAGEIAVSQLTFDGVEQAAGTWGATGSGAAFVDDLHFQGMGTVLVVGRPEIPLGGFTVSNPGSPSGAASATFDTVVGYQYRMVYTDSLNPISWQEVPPGWQDGTGAPMTIADTTATGSQRFYRLECR